MKRGLFFSLFILIITPLWSQQTSAADEQFSFIGMTLAELIERFGIPSSVNAVRGIEDWQDDVVFQYPQGNFYIYRDRVWQVSLTSVYGINNRDRKASVMLILGSTAEDRGDHVIFPVTGKNWPLMMRVNFSSSGLVSAIYIYRPDF
jgi:NAD/NADP transhydrogenase beta subunit